MKVVMEERTKIYDECILYVTEREWKMLEEILKQARRYGEANDIISFELREMRLSGNYEARKSSKGEIWSSGPFDHTFRVVIIGETLGVDDKDKK